MDSTVEIATDTLLDTTVSVVNGDPGEEMSNVNGAMERISSDKEVMREVASALARLELDLDCTSEKLVNMNLFMMHVAAREGDLEAFASAVEDRLDNSAVKALEFDILSGFFDSEVREMDKFVHLLTGEVKSFFGVIAAQKHLEEAFIGTEEKLHHSLKSIKQAHEQVSELMMQSAKFEKILLKFSGEKSSEDKDVAILEIDDSTSKTPHLKMQTAEQQRNILRMLDESLARELDLENKLTEYTQALEEMKHRLHSSEKDVLSKEEQTVAVYAQFLEADNASTVLMGISKDMMGRLQTCQLTINSAMRRENELNIRLQNCLQTVERLEKQQIELQEAAERNRLEALGSKEKVNSLEKQLKESESLLLSQNASLEGNNGKLKELEEKVVICETRAEKAEEQSRLLTETNKGLTKELGRLKDSCIPKEKIESLEKQLTETNIQLQQAMAYVDASQEQQSMLYTSINDMNALIENLKSKVAKADDRADSAEEQCIILSENNAELNEELNFLRGKLECVEASLQQAEETKKATAKDIDIQTQMITDLLLQLAVERERLRKQMSFLMKENRALVEKLHMANKAASNFMKRDGEKCQDFVESKGDNGVQLLDTAEVDKSSSTKEIIDGEHNPEVEDIKFKLEIVRSLDPGRLRIKYILSAIITAVIAVLAACFFWPENCPF